MWVSEGELLTSLVSEMLETLRSVEIIRERTRVDVTERDENDTIC